MLISIIIPTHNRANQLENLLRNLILLDDKVDFEIVVVDNNSKDHTKAVVQKCSLNINYVFEPNTSFSKARSTGVQNSKGEIVVLIDDDIIITPGSLHEIERIFKENPNCAIAGGKILPKFEVDPPEWVLKAQKSFNGFSLFDCGEAEMEVMGIPGPLMAIRKKVFEEIGGFPPDTVGVETNTHKMTFKKLYIGPGDYGFCFLCRKNGYTLIYSPKISIFHVIPPYRMTKEFWISRMVGEGHCLAITERNLPYGYKVVNSRFCLIKKILKHYLMAKLKKGMNLGFINLSHDDIWFNFYYAYFSMNRVLDKNKGLDKYIWEIGRNGVSDNDFEKILISLPKAYQKLAL